MYWTIQHGLVVIIKFTLLYKAELVLMFCGNIDDTHLNFSSLNDFLYSDIFIWGFQGKIF